MTDTTEPTNAELAEKLNRIAGPYMTIDADAIRLAATRLRSDPPGDEPDLREAGDTQVRARVLAGVQSRFVIVHQLRASADIQDRQTKRETGWADTSDRAELMRKAANVIEDLAIRALGKEPS